MKRFFCLKYLLLILLPCFNSCSISPKEQRKQAEDAFADCAQHAVENMEWVSFCIKKNTQKSPRCTSIRFDVDWPVVYYISHDSMEICRMKKDTIFIVNFEDRNIITLNKESGMYADFAALMKNRLGGLHYYYQSAFPELSSNIEKLILTKTTDTLIGGKRKKRFVGNGKKQYSRYDGTTGKLKYRYFEEYHYWIDGQSHQIDSIVLQECQLDDSVNVEPDREVFELTDFCYTDKSVFFDSVFDFSSSRYIGFSRFDEHNFPSKSVNDSVISSLIQHFPLVGIDDDTVRLVEYNRWLLLDLWSLNCKPCIEHLSNLKIEKDTLGCRKVEKDNITILAINYKSNNMDLIRKIADKTSSHDIMYSGKHLQTLMHIPTLGYCYLLAPNKDIVYQGNYDYNKITQAKANYEKQHKNK